MFNVEYENCGNESNINTVTPNEWNAAKYGRKKK